MAGENPIINAILARRSISPRRLTAPGPDERQIRLMVEAAVAAPDHGRLRPWRFIVIHDEDREALASAFHDAALELDPNNFGDSAKREAEKAYNAPCLIAVVGRVETAHPVIPESEQWISIGAAIQNMLLAAEDLGFSAMIVSGKKVSTSALVRSFGLGPHENLVGFIAIGTYAGARPSLERAVPESMIAGWHPPVPGTD